MKSHHYPVYIKRNSTCEPQEAIFPEYPGVPYPVHINLQDEWISQIIEAAGLDGYLEFTLSAELERLNEDNEEMVSPKSLEFYKPIEYKLYLMAGRETFKLKEIKEKAIVLIGDQQQRKAYIIDCHKNTNLIFLTLTDEQHSKLTPPDIDTYFPLEKNARNLAVVRGVCNEVLAKAHFPYVGLHDEWRTVTGAYQDKRQNQCCSQYLPPIIKLSFLIEIAAGTIMSIGSLQMTEGSLIPMDPTAGKITSVVQSILSTLLMLPLVFAGPGAAYMGQFGASFDNFFKMLSCRKKKKVQQPENKCCTTVNAKKALAKVAFGVLLLNYLWTDANYDYLSFKSLMAVIANPDSIFPSWLNTACAWISFSANQANDPAFVLSFGAMYFKLIDSMYDPKVEPFNADDKHSQPADEKVEVRVDANARQERSVSDADVYVSRAKKFSDFKSSEGLGLAAPLLGNDSSEREGFRNHPFFAGRGPAKVESNIKTRSLSYGRGTSEE